ncbi:hypothetical protein BASA60_010356 [Batrachochytrium salamandrivorans]|nr:hypothetical protein BASA60_010356 [Batrachochytrium salamandrivorans]
MLLDLNKTLAYYRSLTLQLCLRPYKKATHLIKVMHLHMRIFNQKRSAEVDTEYGKYPSHAHSNHHHQDRSHPLCMFSPQSDEMPLPAYLGKSEGKSYRRDQKTDEYDAFIASETQYFKSEYLFEKELGKGSSGVVYLATRKSDGMQVAYKSISYKDVDEYALEPSPPPICHLPNSLVLSEEPSVAQCMSSRPPNLLLSYELLLQMYLSRPGHENPYVPTTFDYITLKNKFVLVMEYIGGSWVTLSKYVEGKERPDIVEARNIIREIVNGMIYLKQYGILHRDIHVDTHPVSVDHCILCDQQLLSTSIAHLVVECEQVTGHRIQSGLVPAIQKSRLRLLGRALDPGVENVYTWLRGGVLNGEADLDQRWLDGTVEHGSMGTRHDNRALGSNG